MLGERVYVGPNSCVGRGSRIGDDTRLMSNVTVYHGVRIGARCIIHSGAVIGADGFGIAQEPTGWTKVPQVGGVEVGDDVEIGANTTVDRGAIEDTVIGPGAKLDNQIQIAHNVIIGAHTAMAALTGVAGSSNDRVTLHDRRCQHYRRAHQHLRQCLAGRRDRRREFDRRSPAHTAGFPANVDTIVRWRKNVIRYGQLDEMSRRLRKLEKRIDDATGEK